MDRARSNYKRSNWIIARKNKQKIEAFQKSRIFKNCKSVKRNKCFENIYKSL